MYLPICGRNEPLRAGRKKKKRRNDDEIKRRLCAESEKEVEVKLNFELTQFARVSHYIYTLSLSH